MQLPSLVFWKKLSKEERLIYRFVKKKLGYRPRNIHYFWLAITHKSIAFSDEEGISNERLEFLGDAALDSIIAEFLYLKFPSEDEGYLTKIKSKLVSRKNFSEIAASIGIRDILRYQKGRTININTIEGNAFEALMGAILLDGGYDALKRVFIKKVLNSYADINKVLEEEIDFKSKLFIWCQKNKLEVEFRTLTEENHGGFWKYTMLAVVNNKSCGMGTGSSKKIAEQAASRETLQLMGEL